MQQSLIASFSVYRNLGMLGEHVEIRGDGFYLSMGLAEAMRSDPAFADIVFAALDTYRHVKGFEYTEMIAFIQERVAILRKP